jgi:hypothetical protein
MYLNQLVNKFFNYPVLISESPSDKVTPFMGCTDGHLIPRTCVSNTEHYRHSATNATVTFRNVRRKSNFEVRTCTLIQGSPADIITPTHPNVIGCGMTAPPPVLSPSSILLLTLPRVFSFQQRKMRRALKKTPFLMFYIFRIVRKIFS